MRLSFNTLVMVVLFAATAVFLLWFGSFFANSADELSDSACFTSVAARIAAIKVGADMMTGVKADLPGCYTRVRDVTEDSERSVRSRMANDFLWCYYSYHVPQNETLLTDDDKLCRVCAVYLSEDDSTVGGVLEDISKRSGGKISFAPNPSLSLTESGERITQLPETEFSFPIAIVFMQSRDQDNDFMRAIFGNMKANTAGGAAVGVVEAVSVIKIVSFVGTVLAIGTPPGWVVGATIVIGAAAGAGGGIALTHAMHNQGLELSNNIFILPYNAQALDAYGCTTINPAEK